MYEQLVEEIKNNIILNEEMPLENLQVYQKHLNNLNKSLSFDDEFKQMILTVNNYCSNSKTKQIKTVKNDIILGLVSLCSENLEYQKFSISALKTLGFYASSLDEEMLEVTAVECNSNDYAINSLSNTNISLDEQVFYLEEYKGKYQVLGEELESVGIEKIREETNYEEIVNNINLEGEFKI